MRNWKRMSWLSWLSYFRKRYGHEYEGPTPTHEYEWMAEKEIIIIERQELKQKQEWDGQYSADEIYEGTFDENKLVKYLLNYENNSNRDWDIQLHAAK